MNAYQLTLDPNDSSRVVTASDRGAEGGQAEKAPDITQPLLLSADAPASRIHGFLDLRVATGYLTPRGLQVENQGVVVQPLAGLVFNLYDNPQGPFNSLSFIAGIWSSVHSHHPSADIWNECDLFAGFEARVFDKWTVSVTDMIWTFPDVSNKAEADPNTEYNIEFKLAYDDTEYLKDFALHPYASLFWNYAGDSPVVLGHRTFYVELGIAPSYTLKAIPDLPVTFTFPVYVQVGDSSFWGSSSSGDRSNVGLFSAGVKASVPLTFIPKDFGNWNAYVGVTYIHTCNEALTEASQITGGGYTHERYLGYCGVGMGF
jgi:hypothetical protein